MRWHSGGFDFASGNELVKIWNQYMKYIAGSLIISFGLLFIGVVLSNAMGIKAGDDLFTYLGVAWLVLAAMVYPFSKNLIR